MQQNLQSEPFLKLILCFTEQYLLAINDTSDPEVVGCRFASIFILNARSHRLYKRPQAVKTLKLLYASHTRQGKELQRRLGKGKESTPPKTTSSTLPSPRSTRAPQNAAPLACTSFNDGALPAHMRPGLNRPQQLNVPGNGRPQVMQMGGSGSGYGSRHYFVGQSEADSVIMNDMLRDPSYNQQSMTMPL